MFFIRACVFLVTCEIKPVYLSHILHCCRYSLRCSRALSRYFARVILEWGSELGFGRACERRTIPCQFCGIHCFFPPIQLQRSLQKDPYAVLCHTLFIVITSKTRTWYDNDMICVELKLPADVDFSSLGKFKRTITLMDFSDYLRCF